LRNVKRQNQILEGSMAVHVVIKRRVKQGYQAKDLVPLILQMRALALRQPGYISGETLCDLEHPGDCLVISRWETVNDWNRWQHSKERFKIEKKIEAVIGEETQYNIYSPMVPRQDEN
jgi:antibiotic biosynthesis monooxygenase (ABM) superfamily enzyme